MVIDIRTALNFIENNFLNYTNKDFIKPGNNTLTFNKIYWECNNIHTDSTITNDYVDVLDMDKVCIWVHHNLYDENTINALNRRSTRLLKCLSEKSDTTLLFYIEKPQIYRGKDVYFDVNCLNKYNYKFLILIPLVNFISVPILFHNDSQIKIIYFRSNFINDINTYKEAWNKVKILINKLYNFNIENIADDDHINLI